MFQVPRGNSNASTPVENASTGSSMKRHRAPFRLRVTRNNYAANLGQQKKAARQLGEWSDALSRDTLFRKSICAIRASIYAKTDAIIQPSPESRNLASGLVAIRLELMLQCGIYDDINTYASQLEGLSPPPRFSPRVSCLSTEREGLRAVPHFRKLIRSSRLISVAHLKDEG